MQADLVVQPLMPASNAAFLALFPLVQTGRNWEIKLYHIYSVQIFCSLWRTTSETNKVSWRTVSFKKRQVSYLLLIIQYKNSLSLILKGISKWKWRSGELMSWLLREVFTAPLLLSLRSVWTVFSDKWFDSLKYMHVHIHIYIYNFFPLLLWSFMKPVVVLSDHSGFFLTQDILWTCN